jgi:hypothetical protein
MDKTDSAPKPVYTVDICRFPPDWTRVKHVRLEHSLWLGTAPETHAAMVFDPAEGFRVHMTCLERAPRSVYTAQDDPVWEDSCMEAFLNFAPESGDAYINLETNALGAMRCEFGTHRGGRAKLADMPLTRPTASARQAENSWEAEFFIPLDTVKTLFGTDSFSPGDILRGNFYKCGDGTARPHYGAWAPIEHETPLFHLPAYFGTLVIGQAKR